MKNKNNELDAAVANLTNAVFINRFKNEINDFISIGYLNQDNVNKVESFFVESSLKNYPNVIISMKPDHKKPDLLEDVLSEIVFLSACEDNNSEIIKHNINFIVSAYKMSFNKSDDNYYEDKLKKVLFNDLAQNKNSRKFKAG